MMDCVSVDGFLRFPTEGQCSPSGCGGAGQRLWVERGCKLIVKSILKLQIFCHIFGLEETTQRIGWK